MTYIINPWFFYLSNLSDNFQTLSICVFIIAIFAMVPFIIGWMYTAIDDGSFESEDSELPLTKFLKKMAKISAVLMSVLPSEETINKMVISSFITKENIEGAKTGAKELVDYIVEKAAELKAAELKTSE